MEKYLATLIRIAGILFILLGMLGAYYGPLEIYVFYLFSEGGPFYYDGFGVGSIWFAYLVVQNIGYYLVAALFIPVGIGHLKLRYWALTLSRLYTWFWLGAGVLLLGHFLWIFPAILNLDNGLDLQPIPIGAFLLVVLVLMPVLALIFYHSKAVRGVFEENDPNRYWTERFPFPLLALLLLYGILILGLHIAVFFQGMFPAFGEILVGRSSAYWISLCVLILGILIYGTTRLAKWAWWGGLVFLILLTISSLMSFSNYRFSDLILKMDLPVYEMVWIDKLTPIHDFFLVGLLTAPLLAALGLLIYSKRYFGKRERMDAPAGAQ